MFFMFLTLAWNFTHLGHRILEGKNNTNTAKMIWMFSGYPFSVSIFLSISLIFYFFIFLVLVLTFNMNMQKYMSNNNIRFRKIYIRKWKTWRIFRHWPFICMYLAVPVPNISLEMQRKWTNVRQCSCHIFISILQLLLLMLFFRMPKKNLTFKTLCCISMKDQNQPHHVTWFIWVQWILSTFLYVILNLYNVQRSCHMYLRLNVFRFYANHANYFQINTMWNFTMILTFKYSK